MNIVTSETGLSTNAESTPGIDLIDKSLLSPNEVKYLSRLVRDVHIKSAIHEMKTRLLRNPEEMVLERSVVNEFTDPTTEKRSERKRFMAEGPHSSLPNILPMPRTTTNIVKDTLNEKGSGYKNCFEYSAVQALLAVKFGMINVAVVPYSNYSGVPNPILNKLGFHDHYGILYEDPKEGKKYVMSYSGISYQLDNSKSADDIESYVNNYISSHDYGREISEKERKGYASDILRLYRVATQTLKRKNANTN